jgi:hypothetical protein
MTFAVAAAGGPPGSQADAPVRSASRQVQFVLMGLVAFGVYWLSSFLLVARGGTIHFGADTWFYTELAKGGIFEQLADNEYSYLDRVFRFHPTTVMLAAGWMQIVKPLAVLISPLHLLRAMFALVGAVGVWAALWAFAAVVPQRLVMLMGAIYASSLSIWYFASLEESKIVTATLIVLYIATYLHLRNNWTRRGAVGLTAILLVACLNEIVAGFVVLVPVADTLVQRGWHFRHYRWIACHALAGPIALALLEFIMRGRLSPPSVNAEGANHLSMLIYYISRNDYSPVALYEFAVRWLLFSIAAPSIDASRYADPAYNYGGDFAAVPTNYFSSPVSAGLAILFCVVLAVSVLPPYRSRILGDLTGVMLGLLALALARGVFFLVFIPEEAILFSPGVVLAHLLLIAIPFAASSFPWKRPVLAGIAVLLFVTNASFIIGQ